MPEYIEKTKVINLLIDVENRANRDEGNYKKSGVPLYKDLCKTEILIGKIHPADVSPVVHGSWVFDSGDEYVDYYHCSRCGKEIEFCCEIFSEPKPNYCSNCGAKMDKEV